jgi:hypothetical protein
MKAAEPSMKATARNPGLEAKIIEAYLNDTGPHRKTLGNQILGILRSHCET